MVKLTIKRPAKGEPEGPASSSGPAKAKPKASKRSRQASVDPEAELPSGRKRSRKPTQKGAEHLVGANFEELGQDDLEELAEADSDLETEEGAGGGGRYEDFAKLALKLDHRNRPLWCCPNGRIFLETHSPVYRQAYDFLIAIAEPVCRPECLHEYMLTPHSLYAAVSVGLDTETIIAVLNRLSKVDLREDLKAFIRESTGNYGKVKLVLQRNKFYVESPSPALLHRLLQDEVIARARVAEEAGAPEGFRVAAGLTETAAADIAAVDLTAEEEGDPEGEAAAREAEGEAAGAPSRGSAAAAAPAGGRGSEGPPPAGAESAAVSHREPGPDPQGRDPEPGPLAGPSTQLHSFEIDPKQVEHVKAQCLPGKLNYPMLEEYDFRNDTANPDLPFELKPRVELRPYQEKSMAKMFGNGRARSGIIVLPCGAGKSLVGITAAARIKKSVLCLVTNSVSVDQWRHQFRLWTTLQDHQISRFTSDQKEVLSTAVAGVTITTYTMVSFSGKRSEESEQIMREIQSREWGLLLLDEVHVVPAQMFRKVIGIVKAHCKLGLTATLVREDERISDLNFLIGPKLYEANWLDLTRAGHIANVQCSEVWCPMTREFFREYLKKENAARRQLLYVMNPTKFQACEFLMRYHEQVRGDKVIVFSDNIFALREYAQRLRRPFIYGATSHAERTTVLAAFKNSQHVNTVFLSKVGDNSIDIPEANVLIQISSHAGSRRQEAQRLGRILRAKQSKSGAAPAADEFNAFFYTLVSTDTQEMFYSQKRQQFLVDQGYAFKVVTNLLDSAGDGEGLQLTSHEEQLDLLAKVLSAGEEEAGQEVLPGEAALAAARGRPGVQRTAGSIAALSGAQGLTYLEYSAGKRAGKPRLTTKDGKPRMKLFRDRALRKV